MTWLRELWTQIWITLVVAAVSLALYTSLGRQLIPLVETYTPDIEQQLSQLTGQPVSVGQLQGDWNVLSPLVRLRDIQLGPAGDGLHIGYMEAELDVSASLFYRLPVFRRIQVSGVTAEVHQLSPQHWRIGSQWTLSFDRTAPAATVDKAPAASAADTPRWLAWLELQQNIIFDDWQLVAFDPDNTREDLNIDHLVWRNQGDSHELDGNIAWGREQIASIRAMASLDGDLWPWRDQDGEVYLDIQPQEWSRWIPSDLPGGLNVDQFSASTKAWLSIRDGDLNALYLDAAIPQLTIRTRADTLRLSEGRLIAAGQHNGDDWHLQVRPSFRETLPFSQFSLSQIALPQKKGWQIGIPRLELSAAREFLLRHDLLPQPFDRYVDNLNGRGSAEDLRLSLIPAQPWQVDVRGRLNEVSVDAYHGIPAFSGVSGQVHLQPGAGVLTVNGDDLDMHLADVYDNGWSLHNLSGRFYWQILPDYSRLQLHGLRASLADSGEYSDYSWPFAAELAMALPRSGDAKERAMSLLVGMPQAPARLKNQLLPAMLGDSLQDWIRTSVTAGDFSDLSFVLNTVLEKDHADNSITSQLYMGFSEARLQYLSEWPAVEKLKGRFLLDSSDIDVWVDEGTTLGGTLIGQSGRVQLRPSAAGTMLTVNARLQGDSSEALRYFTETPLQETVNHAFDSWQASGPVRAQLAMDMPLGDGHGSPDIRLDADVSANRLSIRDLNLNVSALSGELRYSSAKGLLSERLEGDTFGGHFTASIDSRPRGQGFDTVLSASGQAGWQAFRQWMPSFLFDPLSGQLTYRSELTAGSDGVRFRLQSDLQGTQIDLPYPMGKDSDASRPLTVMVRPGKETRINLTYDQRVQAVLALDNGRIDRGQVYLGDSDTFLPSDQGLEIRGHIPQPVKAAEWWEVWQRMMTLMAAEEKQARSVTAAAAADNHAEAASGPVRAIELSLDAVDAWGMPMGPTTVTGSQQWNEWTFNVDSTLVKGRAQLKPGNEPVQLDLDYIHMNGAQSTAAAVATGTPESTATVAENTATGAVESSTPEPVAEEVAAPLVAEDDEDPLQDVNPADFPAADMRLAELYIGTRNFGRWNVQARPLEQGMAFKILDSDMKGMEVKGDLQWTRSGDEHHTSLDVLNITSKDIGRVQRAFRQDAVIEGKDMRSTLQLSWQGSPLKFDVPTLNGLASLRIRDGNMAAEGTGALKAFGALNFNSIARRVRLDFSDLYQPGVAFDTMKGKAKVENGVMTLTEPLTIDGPGGKFLTSGSTDLQQETLDMKMVVTFPVSSTLPIVALLAGLAPPVAASIYVTEKLIGDELARFTSASYDLKGSWENPELTINKAFDDKIDGKKERGLWQRIKSIFMFGDDD